MKKKKYLPTISSVTSYLFFFFGLAFLCLSIWQFLELNIPASTLGATAGLIFLLASSIERFEVLKGFGVEARTRIEQKINEAEEIISKLRKLTETTSASIINLNSVAGRITSIPDPKESYKLVNDLKDILVGLGSSEDRIYEILRPWRDMVLNDFIWTMMQQINPYTTNVRLVIENQLNSIGTGDLEGQFQATQAKLEQIATYEKKFEQKRKLTSDIYQTLADYIENYPFLKENLKSHLISELAPWETDLKELQLNYALTDEQKWYDMINARRWG